MIVYFLTSRVDPPKDLRSQKAKVLDGLQPSGTRVTLDQLVSTCLARDYAVTFKTPPNPEHLEMETARSILYHLIQLGPLIERKKVNP
jgi:hypothetical protein